MSDEKPTPDKPEEAEKTATAEEAAEAAPEETAEAAPEETAEAAPEETAEAAPEEAAEAAPEAPVLLEVVDGGGGDADENDALDDEEAEPEEEQVPWINHRLNPQIVEELLDFMLHQKKGQDAHYTNIEVVDIDWEKEVVNTLRHRPKPLESSPEVFSFEFLERFRILQEEGLDSYVIKIT